MQNRQLLASIAAFVAGVSGIEQPTASISNGVLIGTTTSLYAATATVNKFLGIPYAAPPIRFEPPAAASDWSEPRDAGTFGDICMQQSSALSALTPPTDDGPKESEDCLYLNVFQPGGRVPDYGWPVMVWIHGGGLQFGSGSDAYYDGSRFAAYEGVVLVTFNYRLSIFGFPGAPDRPNMGFLDQRFAVQWVQNNIRSFQGDPSRVTIFGESAGGISVDALLTLPPSQPSFHAAIIQSGTVLSNTLASLGQDTSRIWNSTLSRFNCSQTLDPVACLQAIPATEIQDYASKNNVATAIISDNTTYTARSAAARAAGTSAKVPIFVGTTADEGTIFTIGQNNLTAFIDSAFGTLPDLARNVTLAYAPGAPGTGTTESSAIARIFTDVGLQCPAALLTRQIPQTGMPVWRYIYNATFPNLSPSPTLGVFHSSELPIVFSTYNVSTATAPQHALSEYMRGAWAQFAKEPMRGPGWGAVGMFNGSDLGILGFAGSSGVSVVSPEEVDARCSLYGGLYSLLG